MIRTVLSLCVLAACGAAKAAPFPCQPQSLLDVSTIRQQVILTGELHGTQEVPSFVSGLSCDLLNAGRKLVLSMELPAHIQADLDQYLQSDGGELARKRLVASEFGNPIDGRSSQAYLALIEDVRQLKAAGASIGIAATDVGLKDEEGIKDADWSQNLRDRIMATKIIAVARANPESVVVSLSGYVHASQAKGSYVNAGFEPMGYVVAQQVPAYSIGFTHGGGTAWGCFGKSPAEMRCEAQAVAGGEKQAGTGFNSILHLKGLTVSPPARENKSTLGSQGGAQ